MYHPRMSRKTSPSFGQTRIIQEPTPVKRYPPLSNVVQRAQQDPSSVTGDEWQQLQLAIGYRATKGLRSGEKTDWKPKFKGISALYAEQAGQKLPVQAKLVIGQPNDKYEQEADRVAGEVVQQINTPTFIQLTSESLQRQPETESELQTKPETITIRRSPAPKLQREAVAGGETSTDLTTAIDSARGSGQPLEAKLQASMGQAMGADFSRVRIHTDAKSDKLNQSIQAKAFTTGQDVFFRQGEYQPGNSSGQKLIAHELTHVAQQNSAALRRQTNKNKLGVGKKSLSNIIQRKFGFELELHVHVSSNNDKEEPICPQILDKYPKLAKGNGFQINLDHSNTLKISTPLSKKQLKESQKSAPIIELVTSPMDELSNTEQEVREQMQKLVNAANAIKELTANFTKRELLNKVEGLETSDNLYVGSTKQFANQQQSINAYVQQTYGISTKKVTKEFRARADNNKSTIGDNNKKALRDAADHAEKVIKECVEQKEQVDTKEIEGVFALLSYYILMGKINPHVKELVKKKVGLFYYKTKLSTVIEKIKGKNSEIEKILTKSDEIEKISNKILELTGQKEDDKVIAGSEVKVRDWIEKVLKGEDDLIFNDSVNDYSQELFDESLGEGNNEGVGIIVENRKFAATEGKTEVLGRKKPEEWVSMAVTLYNRLKKLHENKD